MPNTTVPRPYFYFLIFTFRWFHRRGFPWRSIPVGCRPTRLWAGSPCKFKQVHCSKHGSSGHVTVQARWWVIESRLQLHRCRPPKDRWIVDIAIIDKGNFCRRTRHLEGVGNALPPFGQSCFLGLVGSRSAFRIIGIGTIVQPYHQPVQRLSSNGRNRAPIHHLAMNSLGRFLKNRLCFADAAGTPDGAVLLWTLI